MSQTIKIILAVLIVVVILGGLFLMLGPKQDSVQEVAVAETNQTMNAVEEMPAAMPPTTEATALETSPPPVVPAPESVPPSVPVEAAGTPAGTMTEPSPPVASAPEIIPPPAPETTSAPETVVESEPPPIPQIDMSACDNTRTFEAGEGQTLTFLSSLSCDLSSRLESGATVLYQKPMTPVPVPWKVLGVPGSPVEITTPEEEGASSTVQIGGTSFTTSADIAGQVAGRLADGKVAEEQYFVVTSDAGTTLTADNFSWALLGDIRGVLQEE